MPSEKHGAICWNELATRDPQAARAFCARLYGWDIQEMPMEGGGTYLVCMHGSKPAAGIFDLANAPNVPEGVPSHWMTYISVDDVDASVVEVTAANGHVVQPPFDVPGVGRIAMITDPSGATVGIMTPVERPST